jgi:hypothetical protein
MLKNLLLKLARIRAECTQIKLSEKYGLAWHPISRIDSGYIKSYADEAIAFAEELGMKREEILRCNAD